MRRLMLLFAALVLVAAACGDEQDPTLGAEINTPPPDPKVNGIIAEDQVSDGSAINVSEVTIIGSSGFIAVHADNDGKPGAVVGHAAVAEGTSLQVSISLDEEIASGDYWPMLHVDAGEIGTYEFPGDDVPATDADGDVVMVKIAVDVQAV